MLTILSCTWLFTQNLSYFLKTIFFCIGNDIQGSIATKQTWKWTQKKRPNHELMKSTNVYICIVVLQAGGSFFPPHSSQSHVLSFFQRPVFFISIFRIFSQYTFSRVFIVCLVGFVCNSYMLSKYITLKWIHNKFYSLRFSYTLFTLNVSLSVVIFENYIVEHSLILYLQQMWKNPYLQQN